MLNDGKIKQPKDQTLEYYKIAKVGDRFSAVSFEKNIRYNIIMKLCLHKYCMLLGIYVS